MIFKYSYQVSYHKTLRHQKYWRTLINITAVQRNSIMLSCLNFFVEYRKNSKKNHQENQDYVTEGVHQDPDHPSTFMKMIKGRANANATANDERHQ